MIKKLDLYILRRFLSRLLFLLIAITAIILLTNLVEMIDNFVDAQMNRQNIINYYVLTIPMIVSYAIPMSVTLATVLSILIYIRNNELLAIKGSGINYFRFTMPIIICAILISSFHFYFENNIVSNSNYLREEIIKKHNLKKKKNRKNKIENFIHDIDGKNKSILIMNYNNKKQIANGITIQQIDNENYIKNRFDSKKMIWNKNTKKWDFDTLIYRSWKNNNFLFQRTIIDTSINMIINQKQSIYITPNYLIKKFIEPEEMNYFELNQFIKTKKESSTNTLKWEVGLHHKLSYVFSSLILAILGLILSAIFKNANTSYGIGLSILIIVLYYVLMIISKNLGIEGVISPFASGWAANITLSITAIYIYNKYVY